MGWLALDSAAKRICFSLIVVRVSLRMKAAAMRRSAGVCGFVRRRETSSIVMGARRYWPS